MSSDFRGWRSFEGDHPRKLKLYENNAVERTYVTQIYSDPQSECRDNTF